MKKGSYILLLLVMAIISGCKTQQPLIITPANTHTVTNPHNSTTSKQDTVYIDQVRTIRETGDTLYIHDSIFIKEWHKWYVHDTINNSSVDTIQTPPQIIEKELSKQQVFLQRSGIALWCILAALILAVVIGIIIKVAK